MDRSITRNRKRWLLLACLGVPAAAPAAEDIFELPLESLMEMRVSIASPFGESVMDSASSVSVLRQADWEERGARSLEDALEQVPSMVPYASLGGATMYAMRGYANELSVRGTALQLDGVPLNSFSYSTAAYSLPFVPLPLLERAEVIRGAGSTLYGSDAFHGVIALNTWQPGSGHREARVFSGSPGSGQAAVTYALDAGAVRGSIGIAQSHSGEADIAYHYIDPLTGAPGQGEWDNVEKDDAGYLQLETGDTLQGLWRFSLYADNYAGDNFPATGAQFFQPLASAVQVQSVDFLRDSDLMGQDSRFWMAQAQHEREVREDLSVHLRAYQWRNDQTWILHSVKYPLDGELLALGGTPLACRRSQAETGVSPLYCPHDQYQGTSEQRTGLTALLRYTGEFNTQWALGAGRDWFEVLSAPVQRIGIDGTVYYNAPAPFAGTERAITHLLMQARTEIDAWSLVYGARWDRYSDINEDAISPRLSFIYHAPDTDWSSKLLYGHAFRAPSAAEQYGSGGGTQQLPGLNLKPETIDTLELVWQRQRADGDTEIVLFGSRWVDGIVLVPAGGTLNRYVNTGENNAHGVEWLQRQRLGEWRIEGNVAWTYSENDRTGVEYTGFPAWTANIGVGRPLGNGWHLTINERVMLDVAEGDVIGTVTPPKAPAYYRTDLHLGWRRDDIRIAFDIRNLFDRDNVTPSMFNARGGTAAPGTDVGMSVEVVL